MCLTCRDVALENNVCTEFNINNYPKENDPLNLGEYIHCYNERKDWYFLDIQKNLYKKCYDTCKSCNIEGNKLTHNCLERNENFSTKIGKIIIIFAIKTIVVIII